MTKAFPLPAEVKGLPPELQNVELTPKQKKRDEARRDQLMKLAGSAARMSPAEADQAHAHTRVSNYTLQLEHLKGLYLVKPKERGMTKAQLDKALAATAVNLAEALMDTGDYVGADIVLVSYKPKHPLRKRIVAEFQALRLPDDQLCNCPVQNLSVRKTIRDIAKNRDVVLVHCSRCQHMNATDQLPDQLQRLQQSRRIAKEGETDAHVFARLEVKNA